MCIKTVIYTFLINGSMTETINSKRGLRQGDPLSPYIFVLLVEYLNRCLSDLKNNPDYNYHPRCQKLGITHLRFADDLLIFIRGEEKSVQY